MVPIIMRLVSYNILDGGEGRTEALADVIESQRPDVVAMVEAENSAVVEQIANRLKIFTFGIERDRIKSAWVRQGEPARNAIAHFPVGVEID